jgi:hypothetical protein
MNQVQALTPEQVVQGIVEYYNSRDIDAFMALFSDDIKFYNFSENQPFIDGIKQCRQFYKDLFDASPNLHSTILKRISFDNKVIDHESIVGRRGTDEALEIVAIYEVKGHEIFRVTVVRKSP